MNRNSPNPQENKRDSNVHVPRDDRLDTGGGPPMPPPDGALMRDEDYAEQDASLLPNSRPAKALQRKPPPGKGQLGVGTAGDAARPSKDGIHNKPVPPRGQL